MLSQLTLRFHKKMIEALKIRAGHENTSVNALAERFLDTALKTPAPDDSWLALVADREGAIRQMYRKIILGQTFGMAPVTRDELRLLLGLAREGYVNGRNRLVSQPALQTLLTIAGELLAWQVAHDMPMDLPYLQGIYHLTGEAPDAEYAEFLAQLRPVINQDYAERLLRPLATRSFELTTFSDEALAEIFTLPRLKEIFPLALRGEGWSEEDARQLADEVHPVIPAVSETIEAGTLRLEIRIDGQHPGARPGAWYETPRLHLLITGQDFVVPYGWEVFSELLGLFTLYARYPEALEHGHQGERVIFSPPGHVSKEGFFGIDGLRIFMPAEAFETLLRELTMKCAEGTLAEALAGLRCLYGDL
ncbi:TPA: transcriptional regulator [Enterobacter hormaechei subsp. steigerwaltii]|nr:transcriptional regulator [Enterobacter hormaechei subsp. steigerwaltii]HAV1841566.1 transcriptional regulator [Enterobacter hormaechei subsp. steigerwaltii]